MIGLGHLPGETTDSRARGVSGDGSVVIGNAGNNAFIWDSVNGMRNLQSVLIEEYGMGDALAGWTLRRALAISEDGLIITGHGTNPSGLTESYVVDLDPSSHPLYPPTIDYPDFSDTSNLTLRKDVVAPVGPNSALRLAPDLAVHSGGAWEADQQIVATAFETEFEFIMGDRISFVIHNDNALTAGGDSGWSNIENSVALSIDRFDNKIAIYHTGREGRDNVELGAVPSIFSIDDGQAHHVKLVYEPGMMSVYVDHAQTPDLSVALDLAELLDLDAGKAWVGLASGNAADTPLRSTDVLNWKFSRLSDQTTAISINDTEIVEGSGVSTTMEFSVVRSGDLSEASTVDWSTLDDTATVAGSDYSAASGQLLFNPGEFEKTISVAVNADTVEESHEQFRVTLSNVTGAFIGNSVAIGRILNDETTLSIADATVVEGDAGFASHGVFGSGSQRPLYNSRGMDFGPDGNLYVSSDDDEGIVRFNGETGAPMGLFVRSDELETVKGMEFGPDGRLYVLSLYTDSILRYGPASQTGITVSLSSPSAVPVTVDFSTLDITATAGSDYDAISGTLTFAPGVTSQTILVQTLDDAEIESTEIFSVTLSNASGATIADGVAEGQILDDDANSPPTADAGSDVTVIDTDDSGSEAVNLVGTASDPDGTIVSYEWTESANVLGNTASISPTLPVGTHVLTLTVTDDDGAIASDTVTVTVEAPASTTVMFISDISFQSRKGGKEWRANFAVVDEFGQAVSGASITVTFAGQTFSGQTDGNGQLRTDWLRLSSGSYEAEVTDLVFSDYTWDLNQGVADSNDPDLYPDALLTF